MDTLQDRNRLYQGDCLEVLRTLPDASVDAVVTDPPAGIAFMNQTWDSDKGGRDAWIAWLAEVMTDVKRVLKPGGHALVWALPRTSHWTGMALEDAGFEIRDCVSHVVQSGFPKFKNVGKELMRLKAACPGLAEEVVAQGQGWTTAIKPAHEKWWLCRKPLAASSVTQNFIEYSTGALNIAACRIESERLPKACRGTGWAAQNKKNLQHGYRPTDYYVEQDGVEYTPDAQGRWPANFLLSHSAGVPCPRCTEAGDACEKDAKETLLAVFGMDAALSPDTASCPACQGRRVVGGCVPKGDIWECAEDCPVYLLEAQGGEAHCFPVFPPDYDPFLYTPKPSLREKNAGCEHLPVKTAVEMTGRKAGSAGLVMEGGKANPYAGTTGQDRQNHHPTVKPIALMRWLCRLITPVGGTVLDPFMGSGSTGCGAVLEGFTFVGIERDSDFLRIARARIEYWQQQARSDAEQIVCQFAPASVPSLSSLPSLEADPDLFELTLVPSEPRRKRKAA